MINKFEIGTLILRVVLGLTFFVHGLVKFQGGIENTVDWFESIGLPGFLAYGVGLVELLGGIALILGLFSRIVSVLIAIIMVGAILKVKIAAGFIDGYELDLALLAMSVFIAINGSKAFAVDQIILNRKKS
ncbi:DoxX family protein [Saliterribacillus persicus]|uniref:Putative membrane protein YphA (DoxX/SURF4 family) n=1 Tax=Saliterribacillus persicus TaxID=930114 RepID=A0A368X622_9BACI|nr:DoxX family protein [Saliterribacillus persicus]RCW63159.1 putative membrane protein YphA (DoxX/SURF4 family) [Saliterribacillus persicus]